MHRTRQIHYHWESIFLALAMIVGFTISCSQTSKRSGDGKSDRISQPNIIFIMADDHAFQAISAYGSSLVETPNIDRLAKEGMRFDRAYVTNSICAPSRAVILTGKFSHLNSVMDNGDVFDSTQLTFPKILRENGYQTAMIGKWHLKSNPTGFDHWKVLPGQGFYYQPEFITPEGRITVEGYVTDILTDMAIQYLDSIRDPAKPFLLMYQHKAPHREWYPSMQQLDAFHHREIPEPQTLFDDYANRGTAARQAEMRIKEHMGLSIDNKIPQEMAEALGYEEFFKWYGNVLERQCKRFTEEERQRWDEVFGPVIADFKDRVPQGDDLVRWKYQRYMQDYLATVQGVDENIGRLLDYLETSGLSENTIVIYTSDQGFYLGEHGWFDKRFMYEESFRTPLIIRWPGHIDPAQVNTDLVQNLDYAPTILSVAGIEKPADMQGMSMTPLFEGDNESWRDAIYYHYYEYPSAHMVKRHYGVRTTRYKLIHFYYDIDEWELYDLEKDPQEMRNVYFDPAYARIREELHSRLEELRLQYLDNHQDKL